MKLPGPVAILKRTDVQWTLVPVLAAAGLAFAPGFDVLSFYFCLPMGLVLAMAAGSVVITAVFHGRAAGRTTGRGIATGMVHAALLPAGPLAVISIAHFINGPCDYLFGLGHFVAGPVASSLTGGLTAAACAVASRRERRASTLFIAIFILSFLPDVWSMYFEPSVRFYNPFLGLYPGPIYDELIEVTPAFVAFRVWGLVSAGALLAGVWTITDGGGSRPGTRTALRHQKALLATLLLAAMSAMLAKGVGDFDFTVGRADIRKELSFSRSDGRCTVLADSSFAADPGYVDLLLRDCLFRRTQTARFFDVAAPPDITVYVYRDADQKARLLGARWVEISKPWLREVHVTAMRPGDMILGHEIAHVVAGRLARNLLAMPVVGGIIPDMGRVEGLAVAAAFADDGPSPHEWAAAMIASGIDPGVEKLFSPLSFIAGGAASSYNTAGSFIRYIHDTSGADAVAAIAAGKSFKDATGRELPELAAQWRDFLEQFFSDTADEALRMRAAARFSDPGVLNRRCPLDVSRYLRDAMSAWDGGDFHAAVNDVREASRSDFDDRYLKRLAARMAFLSGTVDDADVAETIEDVLRPPEGAATMSDRTAAADLMTLRALSRPDDPESAMYLERALTELRDLRAALTSGSALRSICARLKALEIDREAGLAIMRAMSDPRPFDEGDADDLEKVASAHPDVAELQYLAGKAALSDGRFKHAAVLFSNAAGTGFVEPAGFEDASLDGNSSCARDFNSENLKLLGIAEYWSGDVESARTALTGARGLVGFEGDRMLIDEYLDRMR